MLLNNEIVIKKKKITSKKFTEYRLQYYGHLDPFILGSSMLANTASVQLP